MLVVYFDTLRGITLRKFCVKTISDTGRNYSLQITIHRLLPSCLKCTKLSVSLLIHLLLSSHFIPSFFHHSTWNSSISIYLFFLSFSFKLLKFHRFRVSCNTIFNIYCRKPGMFLQRRNKTNPPQELLILWTTSKRTNPK